MPLAAASIVIGLVILVWGADRFVLGAAALARSLGIPPLLVGLTVVGLGTSAPEILVATMAALEGSPGIAIGNVVGSNIWNLLAVLSIPGLLAPGAIPPEVVNRDMLVILALTLALLIMGRTMHRHGTISRRDGGLLLSFFIAYQGWLVWQSHAATE